MAHKVRRSAFETFNVRRKLPVRKKPYVAVRLGAGLILLYRRNAGNGAWIIKAATGDGKHYWTKAFAFSDDFTEAGTVLPDGTKVLTFFEAQDEARKLACRDSDDIALGAPVTVDDALKRYATDLATRGGNAANEATLRGHLTPALLARPVALLSGDELTTWRDGLVAKGLKASSVNRYMGPLRAALSAAGRRDQRVKNSAAWTDHLENLPDASNPRKLFLEPATIARYMAAAYQRSAHFGEFFEVLATGTRASQAARLLVRDFQAGKKPRLFMPKSGKGGSRDRVARKEQRYSVPISVSLARAISPASDEASFDAASVLSWGAEGLNTAPSTFVGVTDPIAAGTATVRRVQVDAASRLRSWNAGVVALGAGASPSTESLIVSARLAMINDFALTSAQTTYTTIRDAITDLDFVMSVYDDEELIASRRCDDVLVAAIRKARAQAAQAILGRNIRLPGIASTNVDGVWPSLVVAQKLYFDARRYADVEAYNPAMSPLFIGRTAVAPAA